MTTTTQAGLLTTSIDEQLGYLKLKVKTVQIVNETNTILHVINPEEILKTIVEIRVNLKHLDFENRNIIDREIDTVVAKTKSIMPYRVGRQKRGLFDIVGSTEKFLFGTMDNEDRKDILNHLKIAETNSHNSIIAINQQIKINQHFNKSIEYLKEIVKKDRRKILDLFIGIKDENRKMMHQQLYLDQMFKLQFLENKLNQIQDNIVSAKFNLLHPSILTPEEIEEYQLDFYKLKLAKVGVLEYKQKFIVIAIKIPKNYITTDVKLITPLPNEENLEINSEDELIVEVRNDTFVYQPQLMLNELKLSKNCVLDKSCKLIFNNVTKVQIIDDESIIVKNAREMKLEQNCDNRNITLNKNNLLNFYNCEIKILRQTFYNNKQMIKEKYFFPQNQVNYSFEKMITFEEIVSGTIGNLKEIKELKFHKELSRYMYGSFLVILMIIIIIVLVFITRCRVKKAYVIQKIQENFHSKRGGVTYNPNEPDTHLHRPINNIAEQVNIPDIPGKSQQIPLTPITANNTKSTVFANLAEIANKYSM